MTRLLAPALVVIAGFVLGAGPLTALTGPSTPLPVARPAVDRSPSLTESEPRTAEPAVATAAGATAAGERLDALFVELRETDDPARAQKIEDEIWGYWSTSEEAVITLLLEQGIEAMEVNELRVAHRKLDAVIAQRPDFAEAFNQRAALRYRLDDVTGSAEDLYKVLYLEPRHFGALMGLANILEEFGQEDRALQALEAARDINPHIDGIDERIRRLAFEVRGRDI